MKLIDLIIKDIKKILYDGKVLAILLLMPLVIMSILGVSLQGMFGNVASGPVDPFKIGVVKEYDANQEKSKFIHFLGDDVDLDDMMDVNVEEIIFEEFLASDDIQEYFSYDLMTEDQAKEAMEEETITSYVVFPENFIYNTYINFMMPGRNLVEIRLVNHPDHTMDGMVFNSIMEGFISQLNMQKVQTSALIESMLASGGGLDLTVIEEMNSMERAQTSVDFDMKSVQAEDLISSFQYYSAAIMAMFMLYAASYGGKALLEEKRDYTLARLSVAGVSLFKTAMSNLVRIMAIVIIQCTAMVAFSSLLLQVYWGDLATVAVGIFFSSFAVASMGLFISYLTILSGNYKMANFYEFAIIQFMALIGGSFLPREVLPKALQELDFLSISGQGIKIFINGMYQVSLSESLEAIGILLAYGLVFLLVSYGMEIKTRKEVNLC